MNGRMGSILIVIVVLGVLLGMSMFTVDQRERALVFQLGEIREVISELTESGGRLFKVNGKRVLIRGAAWASRSM